MLLVVIYFENGVSEERLYVQSNEFVSDVVEELVRKKYPRLIEKSTSFVEMLGKEFLESVKCQNFRVIFFAVNWFINNNFLIFSIVVI